MNDCGSSNNNLSVMNVFIEKNTIFVNRIKKTKHKPFNT